MFIQSGTLGEIIPKLDGFAERIARFIAGAGNGASEALAITSVAQPATGGDVEALRRRVDALEQAVFVDGLEGRKDVQAEAGADASAIASELR